MSLENFKTELYLPMASRCWLAHPRHHISSVSGTCISSDVTVFLFYGCAVNLYRHGGLGARGHLTGCAPSVCPDCGLHASSVEARSSKLTHGVLRSQPLAAVGWRPSASCWLWSLAYWSLPFLSRWLCPHREPVTEQFAFPKLATSLQQEIPYNVQQASSNH